MESSPEASTRSTPDSPVIGLIKNSITPSPSVDMPSREPPLEVSASTTDAAGEGTSSAAGCGGDRAEG